MIKRFRLPTWLLAAVVFSAGLSQGEDRRPAEDEDTVKVAVLVKLIQFVSWPDAAAIPAGKPATLCVLGKDRWIPLLQHTVQGESLNDRPIAVTRITKAREASACQILVVGGAIERESLEMLQNSHVLTISDDEPYGVRATMVSLSSESGRTRFKLNLELAEKARVRFSAKLLQLAGVVSRGAE
jgi:hypothetical protein